MIVIGCLSLKGGVGKTAAAVNLAYLASREGLRTLLWDLDVQGAASYHLRVRPDSKSANKQLLKKQADIHALIRETDHERLDLLPADTSCRKLERLLDKQGTKSLALSLRPVRTDYDLVIMDCPPGLGRLAEAVMRTCQVIVSPLHPNALSMNAYLQMESFRRRHYPGGARLLPFYSMVDARRAGHRSWLGSQTEQTPTLTTQIPLSTDVERMTSERLPVELIARKGRAAEAYRALWEELRSRLILT